MPLIERESMRVKASKKSLPVTIRNGIDSEASE